MLLRDVEFTFWSIPEDVEAEKVGDWTTVGAFETIVEFCLELVEFDAIRAGN